jgi:hypothetical protein
MKNKTRNIVIILLSAFVFIPVLVYLGLCTRAFYMNINPDHVNIEKDGWKFILSFKTIEKNVRVEIYGRPLQKPNSGEFIMVRKGLLPFKIISISKIYLNLKSVWFQTIVVCDSLGNEGNHPPSLSQYTDIRLEIGDWFDKNEILFNPIPYLACSLTKPCPNSSFFLSAGIYCFCDNIPFLLRFKKNRLDVPDPYSKFNDLVISNQIETIFKKPSEDFIENNNSLANKQ